MKRTTEITFEIEETIIARSGGGLLKEFCDECQTRVTMATPSAVSALTGISEREIFRMIERGEIHFLETDRILICLNFFPPAEKGESEIF